MNAHKRITSIQKDLQEHVFTYNLEERNPNNQILKGVHNMDKLNQFLGSLNDNNAIYLIHSITELMSFTLNNHNNTFIYPFIEANYNKLTTACSVELMQMKLDQNV